MSDPKLSDLIRDYKSTYTVPKHPKKCPVCGHKVGVYHMNFTEAFFQCSNEDCVWPLTSLKPHEFMGQSDVRKLVKIQVEKRKIKSSTSSSNDSAFDSSYESSTKSDNEDLSHEKRQSTVKSATNVPLTNSTPEKS